MKKAIFLDRDGVLNEVLSDRVKFVNKPEQLFLLEGAAEAVADLTKAGYEIFVVTNQGGVGLGFLKEKELKRIHERLQELVAEKGGHIKEVAYCPHKPKAGCECRKPNAGMLLDLAERYNLDLANSLMVGDHERDIEAGKKAGCKTVFIGSDPTKADIQAPSLFEAVGDILELLK
ncbi:D-glycero-D-manno-heptose 1,7-bisphosphate phosphatase [Cytobacillus oceanisediminis]|jgi:D-glycero-D-manno-heptose 1,7-bisphosphate phosphatase|uniref:D,D-heptose 1,7-bisphosphate phosphatase n=1 Tax=Cytobacillus oceanisediminis TaxID=665099 RepID=A0A2V2ZTV3_9BACI|nr:HAD family hydrolase [Cytobacillus oceanisediminis]PWW27838.1 D-glycero-D-manno-heptose 1,7-bisphosphate phosphatase [Cytobacillus oceanisediminis]